MGLLLLNGLSRHAYDRTMVFSIVLKQVSFSVYLKGGSNYRTREKGEKSFTLLSPYYAR